MRLPSEAIPVALTSQDARLVNYMSLLDHAYASTWKKLLFQRDLINPDYVSDSLLNYYLYSYGVPLYWKYTAAQKRSMLDFAEEPVVGESVGTSGASVYSGTLLRPPIKPDAVTFKEGVSTLASDDKKGILTGTNVVSGWINYNTGEYYLKLLGNTASAVTVDYTTFYSLDSKRYTLAGLFEFLEKILGANLLDVQQFYRQKQKMYLEFRLYGFPNTLMRSTAGQELGDMVGYVYNQNTISATQCRNDVLLYTTSAISDDDFNLFKQVLVYEIKDLDFEQTNTLYTLQPHVGNTVTIAVAGPVITATGTGGSLFLTWFASPGDQYIGVVEGGDIVTYQIESVDSNTQLTLTPGQTVTAGAGKAFYKPDLTRIGQIGF